MIPVSTTKDAGTVGDDVGTGVAGRLEGWPGWARVLLGVLAWAAALAAVFPLVRGYLTSLPDQRMVDLGVYRAGGLSVLRGQPLYTVVTPPPQLLPFTYPPAAALFAVPLALLSWPAAQLAWVPVIYLPLVVLIWFAFAPLPAGLGWLQPVVRHGVTPAVLAVATVWVVVLMLRSGRAMRPEPPGAGGPADPRAAAAKAA